MDRRHRTYRTAVLLCVALTLGVTGLLPKSGTRAAPPQATSGQHPDTETYDWKQWRQFWSLQPVQRPALPEVKDKPWVRNPVDAFVLAKLEAEDLKPAAEADKLTLIRRATFDLIGLPPTPEEVRDFQKDRSADAYEKLIGRLLASPHYGERWGRHWLDVARYTPGRVTFPGTKNTKGDQHYRDYVVRAFNQDKPYDQFLTEQLAGDLLPGAADRQQHYDQITAPAFLSIGAWFDMCTDPNRLRLEMIDEMINTTSQAFLGLSVSCARCHDHKFDPIPTADYYALAGVFRSTRLVGDLSEFWRDGRVRQLRPLAMPDEVAANDQIRELIDRKKAEQWDYLARRHAELTAQWKADEAKYWAAAAQVPKPFVKIFEAEQFDGQDNLRTAELMRDGAVVQVIETQTPTANWVKYKVEVPETTKFRLEALYSSDERTPVTLLVNGEPAAEDALATPTGGWDLKYQRWQSFGAAPFELRKGLNFLRITNKVGNFPRIDRFRLVQASEPAEQQIRQLAETHGLHLTVLENFVKDPEQPWPTVGGLQPYLPAEQQKVVDDLGAQMAALEATIAPYEMVVAVTDQRQAADLPIHVKGDTYKTTDHTVPRGMLRLTDHALPRPSIPPNGSGRLELARWMTDRNHPLTSRVMANRIWHWHFGRGIVASTSDFGSRGDPPTHPELLDWLAAEFMENGWSIKHLHRLLMTSSTYRMSSRPSPEAQQRDPENKLLSHANRRRLEAEAIYDAMRSTTNMIPRQEPGKPLDYDKSGQRAMYAMINGKSATGSVELRKFFALFDCELIGLPVPVRPVSTTPSQSLFFLNNKLPKWMADRFAQRLLQMDKLNDSQRLEMAYLLALGRKPEGEMVGQGLAFIQACDSEEGMTRQEAWSRFCQMLYATAEFRYVD